MQVRQSIERALAANLAAFGDAVILITPAAVEYAVDSNGDPLLGIVEDATKVMDLGIDGEPIMSRLSVTIPTHLIPVPITHPPQSKRKWRVRIGTAEHLVEAIYPDRTTGITTFMLSISERVSP